MLFNFFLLSLIDISETNSVATITGDSVIERSNVAVKGYTTWTKIIINYGPTGVGSSAFYECSALEILDISLSVSSFAGTALRRCTSLKQINVPDQHLKLYSDEQFALYTADKTQLIHCPSKLTQFIIPESVKTIKENCFNGNKKLTNLNIPPSVTTLESNSFNEAVISELTFSAGSQLTQIPTGVFFYCTITKLHIPPSVKVFYWDALTYTNTYTLVFDDLSESNLTTLYSGSFVGLLASTITLPPKITELPSKCFTDCPNLKYVNIPRDCQVISESAFSGCKSLKEITVDPGNKNFSSANGAVLSVDSSALYFLPSGMTTLVINKELTKIAISALQVNTNLKEIVINDSLTFSERDGVLYNYDGTQLLTICGGIKEVVVKSSVESIENSAFFGTQLSAITFESMEKLTIIKENGFRDCTNIKQIVMPKSIKTIDQYCFKGCSNLESVVFDEDCKLSNLGQNVFDSSGLTSIALPRYIEVISYCCFNDCKKLKTVSLPESNSVKNLSSGSFQNCPLLESFSNPVNIELIETSAFENCVKLVFPFEQAKSLTTINSKAFANTNCEVISLCSSIQSIGSLAFSKCSNLQRVEFSADSRIESLGSSAFSSCPLLNFVKLSTNISSIDFSAFSECWELTTVDTDASNFFYFQDGIIYSKDKKDVVLCLPGTVECPVLSSVENILKNAFSGCQKVKRVEFNENERLQSIGESTFMGCSGLTDITIPDSVNSMGARAFSGCSSLHTLPVGPRSMLQALPAGCFSGCGFESVAIEKPIVSVGEGCFTGCQSLKDVVIGSNAIKIGSGCFSGCPKMRRVRFCGVKDISEGELFDPGVMVLVSRLYQNEKFGGSLAVVGLDEGCVEITAGSIRTDAGGVLCWVLIADDE